MGISLKTAISSDNINYKKKDLIFIKIASFFATGFYIGLIPVAPGTFGSLPGILLAFWLNSIHPVIAVALFLLLFFAGIFMSGFVCEKKGIHDPGYIVIDEILGMALALLWIEMSVINVIMCFIIFRVFDIAKPFPISYFDKNIKGGLGIITDDLVAGIFTNILVNLFIRVMV